MNTDASASQTGLSSLRDEAVASPSSPKASIPSAGKKKSAFKRTYIVWSPEGTAEPRVVHPSHGSALRAAHNMSHAYPGQTFFVMQSASRPIVVQPTIHIERKPEPVAKEGESK